MNARDEIPILNRLVWDYERDTMGKPLGKSEYTFTMVLSIVALEPGKGVTNTMRVQFVMPLALA